MKDSVESLDKYDAHKDEAKNLAHAQESTLSREALDMIGNDAPSKQGMYNFHLRDNINLIQGNLDSQRNKQNIENVIEAPPTLAQLPPPRSLRPVSARPPPPKSKKVETALEEPVK